MPAEVAAERRRGRRDPRDRRQPGSMVLKGATPDHEGDGAPDRWSLGAELREVAERWGIDARARARPERRLTGGRGRGPGGRAGSAAGRQRVGSRARRGWGAGAGG